LRQRFIPFPEERFTLLDQYEKATYLELPVPAEGLGVSGQPSGVPAVVTGVLAGQVAGGVTREGAQELKIEKCQSQVWAFGATFLTPNRKEMSFEVEGGSCTVAKSGEVGVTKKHAVVAISAHLIETRFETSTGSCNGS
jgi:hypothetical protein